MIYNQAEKFLYHYQGANIEEAVIWAYEKFYIMTRKFPKVLGVPLENAGYINSILVVKIDRSIRPGTIWLAADGG